MAGKTTQVLVPIALGVFAAGLPRSAAQAQSREEDQPQRDHGTNPTRTPRSVSLYWEHYDLRDHANKETLSFRFETPVTDHTAVRLTVPTVANNAKGREDFGLGDISLRVRYIPFKTETRGLLMQAEVDLDTASRPELGAGQTVMNAKILYAFFQDDGAIIAPSLEQGIGIAGVGEGEDRVSTTTLDFYYVPKFKDDDYYMTIDPAFVYDWQGDTIYASVGVTAGKVIGHLFGGDIQIYANPTLYLGGDRPGDWSMEMGVQLVDF